MGVPERWSTAPWIEIDTPSLCCLLSSRWRPRSKHHPGPLAKAHKEDEQAPASLTRATKAGAVECSRPRTLSFARREGGGAHSPGMGPAWMVVGGQADLSARGEDQEGRHQPPQAALHGLDHGRCFALSLPAPRAVCVGCCASLGSGATSAAGLCFVGMHPTKLYEWRI